MKRSYNIDGKTSAIDREAGFALILFMLTLPVLLGLAALALDTGNLYLARERLNKTVRSSAATAFNIRAHRGWARLVTGDTEPDLGSRTGNRLSLSDDVIAQGPAAIEAAAAMKKNAEALITQFYPGDKATIPELFQICTDDPGTPCTTWVKHGLADYKKSLRIKETDQIRLRVRYPVQTFLMGTMGSLIGIDTCSHPDRRRCWVTSDQVVANDVRPANVWLLLDVSGSMGVPLPPTTRSKKEFLDSAVAAFVDFFNPFSDRITIIPYNQGVRGVVPVPTPTTFAQASATNSGQLSIKTSIIEGPGNPNFSPNGQTNPCDALIETIRRMDNDPLTPDFVVLFTDGAPNVYRLKFCGQDGTPNCGLAQTQLHAAAGEAGNNLGWYGWTVDWGVRATTVPSPCGAPKEQCDPVFGNPKIINPDAGDPLPQLRQDENGIWYRRDLAEPNLAKQWKTLESLGSSLDIQSPLPAQSYRWFGPSYLVNATYRLGNDPWTGFDRVIGPAITCGPPTAPAAKGSLPAADQYNHSRYFASRVLNANWNRAGFGGDTGLNALFPVVGPNPLARYFIRNNQYNTPGVISLPNNPPGCLQHLNSSLPFTADQAQIWVSPGNRAPNANDFRSNTAGSPINPFGEIMKTAELPYYCAIRAADYLRTRNNAVIFTVGLGQSATTTYGATCNDPLQNALDFQSRKDHFLRRLAFAPESLEFPSEFFSLNSANYWKNGPGNFSDFRYQQQLPIQNCGPNHPLNGTTVNIGYAEDEVRLNGPLNPGLRYGRGPNSHGGTFNRDHLGAYYGSNNPDELGSLFSQIAKTILLRVRN